MKTGISKHKRKALLLLMLLGSSIGSYAATTAGSITLTGAEQFNSSNGMWDAGNVTVSINGYVKTVPYGQYSTPDSIASAIAALFTSDCNGPANARSAPGGVIYVQMRDGVALSQLTTNTYSSISFAAAVNSNLIQTTTTATIGSTQLLLGQTTPINVQVSCNSACGSVDYRLDGGEWGTVALDANGHFTAGTGSNWSPGLHNVVIRYQGNATYAMSTSNPVSFMISSSSTSQPPTPIYGYDITTYQANGNVSAYTDSTASANETWSNIQYDGVNRLTQATQTLNSATQYMCWGYDSFGNRTAQVISGSPCSTPSPAVTYNANNQNTALGYDASGDVTNDGTNQYLYDAEGRVCAVQYQVLTGGPVSMMGYLYDAEGRRVAKGTISSWSCDPASNGFQETAGYVLGPDGEQLTEVDGQGNWFHTNVYAAGSLIATYNPDGLHFHLDDWFGTRRVDTDYAGNPESTYHSLPYGEMVPSNQTISNTEHFFTGKERDTESGLDYFGARYYASTMGRFSSPDPSGLYFADPTNPQSLNLYSYAVNNPLKNTDPTGMAYCQWNDNGVISRDDSANTGVADAVNSGTDCTNLGGEWKHDDGLNDDGSPMGSEDKPAFTTTVTLNTATDQTSVSLSGPYYDPQEVWNYMLIQGVAQQTAWFPDVCSVGAFYYYGKGVTALGAKGFVGGIVEVDSESGKTAGSLVEGGIGTVGGGRVDTTHGTSYLGYKELAEIPFGASAGGLGYHDVGGRSGFGGYAEAEGGGRERGVGIYASVGTMGGCRHR